LYAVLTTIATALFSLFAPVSLDIDEPPISINRAEAQEVSPLHIFDEAIDLIVEELELTSIDVKCYCVTWLRQIIGVNIKGDADTIIPNVDRKDVWHGDIILFKYSNAYHAAQIKEMRPDGYLVQEANKERCKVTERLILYEDSAIRGFYRDTL